MYVNCDAKLDFNLFLVHDIPLHVNITLWGNRKSDKSMYEHLHVEENPIALNQARDTNLLCTKIFWIVIEELNL